MASRVTSRQQPLPSRRVVLPGALRGQTELQSALRNRRSHRAYAREELALDQLSQILWSA